MQRCAAFPFIRIDTKGALSEAGKRIFDVCNMAPAMGLKAHYLRLGPCMLTDYNAGYISPRPPQCKELLPWIRALQTFYEGK